MLQYERGRKLKDTLMGEARQGKGYFRRPPSNELTSIDVLLKYFNKRCVMNGVTLSGQPVAEDPRTELTLQTRISTPDAYPASLLSSPSYLDRVTSASSTHIVRLYDVKDDGESIVAIMEFAHGGELFSLLSTAGPSFTLAHAKAYTVQLLLAVHALHALDIVHRDISLENILLTKDRVLRLCDLGLAREVPRGQRLSEAVAVGKTRYMSPEVFSCIAYDPRLSDLWSVGVCLFVMVNKNFPWNFPHSSDPLFVMICSGRINDVMRGWGRPQLQDSLVDLFSHFFCPEERRWSIQQLLDSDWLRGVWNAPRAEAPQQQQQRLSTLDQPHPVPPARSAQSAPASLSVSTTSSAHSSPPSVAEAVRVGAGSASPLSLATASMEDLSANEPDRAVSPAPPSDFFAFSSSSSLSSSRSSSDAFDNSHLNRSMSPSFALSSSAQRDFPQEPLFFNLQETAVMRSIDLPAASASCSSAPSLSSSALSASPRSNGVASHAAGASASSDALYPSLEAADALASSANQLPMGPSLDHSKSRVDR